MTQKEPLMTFDDAAAMGLSRDEWDLILKRLDRTPNQCELGIFSLFEWGQPHQQDHPLHLKYDPKHPCQQEH